jgi:hypothetical protein
MPIGEIFLCEPPKFELDTARKSVLDECLHPAKRLNGAAEVTTMMYQGIRPASSMAKGKVNKETH